MFNFQADSGMFHCIFLLIKCSHGASFKNEKDKWQTIRKHQYIMWQRQVWDLEFWRIFQNILKFFSKVWNTIRWPFCKTGKIFRCFQLILLPFENTHYVIVPIRTVVQKTQFHFVVNMHTNHFLQNQTKLYNNFLSYIQRDNLDLMVSWARALVQITLKMPKSSITFRIVEISP